MTPQPFIPTQRLFRLVAPPEKRRQCLTPDAFRALRGADDGAAQDLNQLPGDHDLEGCHWKLVENRLDFLAQSPPRKQCVSVDAGTGKTTSLKQLAFLRSNRSGHLVVRVDFARLPDHVSQYLDGSRHLMWWVQEQLPPSELLPGQFHQNCDREPRLRDIEHLLHVQLRRGRFTLLVDALDQTGQRTHVEEKAEALAAFLKLYPRACCVVTGRPYAIDKY